MKLIDTSVEIYEEPNNLLKIETIARTCTGTADKAGKNSKGFCKKLLSMGHMSPFEHVWVYPKDTMVVRTYGSEERYLHTSALNGRDYIQAGGTLEELQKCKPYEGIITAKFICDIGLSRELLRHRQMSFMEQSTRYTDLTDTPMIDPYYESISGESFVLSVDYQQALSWYNSMIERGIPKQYARYVLPLGTATVLYMTGTISQWKQVLALRLGKGAHPEMRKLMQKFVNNSGRKELAELAENDKEGNSAVQANSSDL